MAINSASTKIISATIGFDEAEMYGRMSDMQPADMPVLSNPEYSLTPAGAAREDRVDALPAHLTAVMKEEFDADYFMFPLVLKYVRSQSTARTVCTTGSGKNMTPSCVIRTGKSNATRSSRTRM
jgi:alpha-D-ribose 1-methylphosphonate 5-phosphate C-P lyase